MAELTGRRILVTGAGGFVGANLVRALVERCGSIHALLRSATDSWRLAGITTALRIHRADVNDFEAVERVVEEARPDCVFHCAMASGHPTAGAERLELLRTAVLGTAHLLEATSRSLCRFVHLGSFMEYGADSGPARESEPASPSTLRGAAKAAASLLCRQRALETGQEVVVLRLFTVYGPWEGEHRLVPSAIRAALGGSSLPLTPRPCARDWIFVDDVVEACIRAACLELSPGTIINVGTGALDTNHGIVDVLEEVSGVRVERTWDRSPSPWDAAFRAADISTAKHLLGWEPAHTLRQGLVRTVEWTRARMPATARPA